MESLFRSNGVLRNITHRNYPRSLAELSKNILQTICYIRTLRKHLPVVVFKKSSFLFHISTCECSRYIFFSVHIVITAVKLYELFDVFLV